jgi:spermidine synthase
VKRSRLLASLGLLACLLAPLPVRAQAAAGDFERQFASPYNTITIARKGSVVEMRARLNAKSREYLESAVNLEEPLRLVVPYTRTLFAGLFIDPAPKRVLMIGLGGGGFHRLFVYAHPQALLHTVELDPKVLELAEEHMGFRRFDRMPVTIADGRVFIKHNDETWDWIILDAFRGGFVPPHLKTKDFYEECAARLGERGVLISNLHDGTKLFAADLKTLTSVFPQVVLFNTGGRGNVIACAVKYTTPDITDPANWTAVEELKSRFSGWLPIDLIRDERMPWPTGQVAEARVLTDDFNPVEMLNAIEANNETQNPGESAVRTVPGFVWPAAGGVLVLLVGVFLWRGRARKKRSS